MAKQLLTAQDVQRQGLRSMLELSRDLSMGNYTLTSIDVETVLGMFRELELIEYRKRAA